MRRPKETGGGAGRQPVPLELVERCKAGDEQAWAELVRATHREVYTLCLRILRDPDDAAEATQEAFVKAWRGLKGFRGDSQFDTWLYRVATNAAISRHRSRKRRRDHETDPGDEYLQALPGAGSVEAQAGARLDMAVLEKALASLPEHYRVAVVMRDVYGATIQEIATQLKISETAAKVRVHRGRKKLRDRIFATEEDFR